jgi:peptide/nickel transport system permease protein
MYLYLLKRIAYSFLVILGVSVVIFFIVSIIPGNPARIAAGAKAPKWAVEKISKEMGLDKPIVERYFLWLGNIFKGDMGKSLVTRRPVIVDIGRFLPATLQLVLLSGTFIVFFGITFGRISARYANTWLDGIFRVGAYIGIVTPAFVWAVLFVLIFGYWFPVFPTSGMINPGMQPPPRITGMYFFDGLITGHFLVALSSLEHILLPSLALAMGPISQEARITRSTMVDAKDKDYVLSARAYGVPPKVINKHLLLKPSLIPTVSVMALDISALLGNAFLVELIFDYPGLSHYGVVAMLNKDIFAIIAVVLIIGITYVIANVIVDLILAKLDPRVAFGGGKANA